jgi:hypothetical protein
MGTNFTAYINRFRIEEARELLAARPELTVLPCLGGRFSETRPRSTKRSGTSTGMTPSEFKKRNRQDR